MNSKSDDSCPILGGDWSDSDGSGSDACGWASPPLHKTKYIGTRGVSLHVRGVSENG